MLSPVQMPPESHPVTGSAPASFRLRFARPGDAAALALLYIRCNAENSQSFLSKLGPRFVRAFYSVTLRSPYSIGICAESGSAQILGFATGTLDASDQMKRLSRARWRLLWAALPRLVKSPRLIAAMRRRSQQDNNEFIITSGARWEYWAWDPLEKAGGQALRLHAAWLQIARQMGATAVFIEVNESAAETVRIHRVSGAQTMRQIVTPEGVRRVIMQYSFK